jgi:peptidoglycan/xylan/chitin deacetylase (PgdA/CDA1 family)
MYWSGAALLCGSLPARNTLLVLVYHRIGNRDEELFDPGIFSATGEQLDEQIAYLKRVVSLVTLEEALAFIEGKLQEKKPRCRVLITFDDGYLDNYEIAFPVLRSHGVQGVFFLSTGLIGSSSVPWWDEIAFVLKTARERRFSLRYPTDLRVDLVEDGVQTSIRNVIELYKSPANKDPERLIRELEEMTKGEDLPENGRRFLSWDEAKAMIGGGMAIGSHCHSHCVLSKLQLEEQSRELNQSRGLLKERLGINAEAIAYPIGGITSFSEQTQALAQKAGYSIAFSYYGGTNPLGQPNPYNVKRTGILADQSQLRFRVQTTTCRATGKYWP